MEIADSDSQSVAYLWGIEIFTTALLATAIIRSVAYLWGIEMNKVIHEANFTNSVCSLPMRDWNQVLAEPYQLRRIASVAYLWGIEIIDIIVAGCPQLRL